jgi:hypothetical protein
VELRILQEQLTLVFTLLQTDLCGLGALERVGFWELAQPHQDHLLFK